MNIALNLIRAMCEKNNIFIEIQSDCIAIRKYGDNPRMICFYQQYSYTEVKVFGLSRIVDIFMEKYEDQKEKLLRGDSE